jgi:hypothetical protein
MPREPSHGFSSIGEIFLLTFPFIEQLAATAVETVAVFPMMDRLRDMQATLDDLGS